jgi:hypothetical protein
MVILDLFGAKVDLGPRRPFVTLADVGHQDDGPGRHNRSSV